MMLALVGPTACGKTEASIRVARELGAEIVSIDSMLVYRGMDVGTAKPSTAERAAVPHHLIDVIDPDRAFSVAEFQRLALAAVRGIEERGRRTLLVGGSGLYFRAVADRLTFPGTKADTRATLEAEAVTLGPLALHQRLVDIDPAAASRIQPANVRRTVRALEVAAVTGRPFSTFGQDWERYPRGNVRVAGIDMPRDVLIARIEARVEAMMPGLLEETRALVERGFGGFLTSIQAIGYAEASACLAGEVSEAKSVATIVRRTKALARRQVAWFRRDPRIRWFAAGAEGAGSIAGDLIEYLGGKAET
jgi:tRNA dimethylallyltransferase